jgi:hypothetical protein
MLRRHAPRLRSIVENEGDSAFGNELRNAWQAREDVLERLILKSAIYVVMISFICVYYVCTVKVVIFLGKLMGF